MRPGNVTQSPNMRVRAPQVNPQDFDAIVVRLAALEHALTKQGEDLAQALARVAQLEQVAANLGKTDGKAKAVNPAKDKPE